MGINAAWELGIACTAMLAMENGPAREKRRADLQQVMHYMSELEWLAYWEGRAESAGWNHV